jgi:hypothetical protein
MDADERDVCNYLKSWPGQFVFGRDVARRAAGKHRFREDPEWAEPVLARLVASGVLESDSTGHYRLRAKTDKLKARKWVSPHIKKILDESGKDFTETYRIGNEDDDELG